ncbi:MAG: hypothetical protein INF92_05820 [Rhodobacter sp.]|nr:hypothetical protein [Rhodobacter sp.]
MFHRFMGALLASALAAGAPAIAVAQDQDEEEGLSFEADALFVFQGDANLETSGKFSANRSFASIGAEMPLGERASLEFEAGLGGTNYDFSGVSGFPLANELGWVQQNEISLRFSYSASDRLEFFLEPGLSLNGESGADSGDGTTSELLAGFTWQFNPRLIIGPAVGLFESLVGDDDVVPILLIDWQISDTVSLSTARGLAASRGPGLTLSWQANDVWSFGLQGRLEDVQFRLDNNHGAASGGVAEEAYTPVVATASWRPNERMEVMGFAGVATGGEFTLYDSKGTELSTQTYEDATLFGLVATLRF